MREEKKGGGREDTREVGERRGGKREKERFQFEILNDILNKTTRFKSRKVFFFLSTISKKGLI